MRRCEGAGCPCERSGECPIVHSTDAVSFVVVDVVSGKRCAQYDSREEAQQLADECNAEWEHEGADLIGFNSAYRDPFIVEVCDA